MLHLLPNTSDLSKFMPSCTGRLPTGEMLRACNLTLPSENPSNRKTVGEKGEHKIQTQARSKSPRLFEMFAAPLLAKAPEGGSTVRNAFWAHYVPFYTLQCFEL